MRDVYEKLRNKKCSDGHWWKVTTSFERAGIPLTLHNLQLIVAVRKITNLVWLELQNLEAHLDKTEIAHQTKGVEILKKLGEIAPSASKATLYRWISKIVPKFNERNYFDRKTTRLIYLQAKIYKSRIDHNHF